MEQLAQNNSEYIADYDAVEAYREYIHKIIFNRMENIKEQIREKKKKKDYYSQQERNELERVLHNLKGLYEMTMYVPDNILYNYFRNKGYINIRFIKGYDKHFFAWKKQVHLRDNNKCRRCGLDTILVAHHIIPYNRCPELRYDINNGITFCEQCHSQFHKKYGILDIGFDEVAEFLKTPLDYGDCI